MKISILILTHNRPKLFDRCIKSVIDQITDDVEVIVNNDSRDITETPHPAVTYHYNQYNNLCSIYEFLLSQASGEFVYFLEDDDYLNENFFKISLDADVICGNYMPTYKPNNVAEYACHFKDRTYSSSHDFLNTVSTWHLQLSQYIFKRSIITDFPFAYDSHVHNDQRLVEHAVNKSSTIKSLSKVLYYQTVDGGDNISFPNDNDR